MHGSARARVCVRVKKYKTKIRALTSNGSYSTDEENNQKSLHLGKERFLLQLAQVDRLLLNTVTSVQSVFFIVKHGQ